MFTFSLAQNPECCSSWTNVQHNLRHNSQSQSEEANRQSQNIN